MTTNDRWCILRTSGANTLPLMHSLVAAGIEAWTPAETRKHIVRQGRERVARERAGPILPTFVFARSDRLNELLALSASPLRRHPDFTVFLPRGATPLIRGSAIAALQAEEAAAMARIQAVREVGAREAARRERAGQQRTLAAQRKALRSVRRDITPGTMVSVTNAPMLEGLAGEIIESRGTSAIVLFGTLRFEVEAWQLATNHVDPASTSAA